MALNGVSQIYSFCYSKDKLFIYYAVEHIAGRGCHILKYNLNDLANNISSRPITTYIPSVANNRYERVE